MQYRIAFLGIFLSFFISFALLTSCGGDGSDGSSGTTGSTSSQTTTLKGTIADVVAKEQSGIKTFLIANLKDMLTISKIAVAQPAAVDLSGIEIQAFDSDGVLVGEGISDVNGNFEFEVPCDTPLTLLFTLDGSSVELGGVVAPCPVGEDPGTSVFITVNLNFNEEVDESDESTIEIEEEEGVGSALISCNNKGDLPDLGEGEDLIINGGGEACIITAGNCDLEIIAANVELNDCSTCIDTRGTSSVKIEANSFICNSTGDGVRSVGTSDVEIKVLASEAPIELNCTDGIDDDLDGDIDCADFDCAADVACTGVIEDCTNGIDDDGDLDVDCADTDCAFDPACGATPEDCTNGIDDDGDLDVDCADTDCIADPACAVIVCGSLSIMSGEDGVDATGNSSVKFDGDEDDSEIMGACGDVSITGAENSISAKGNSDVEVKATSCTLIPDMPVEKGNAEVIVECNGE